MRTGGCLPRFSENCRLVRGSQSAGRRIPSEQRAQRPPWGPVDRAGFARYSENECREFPRNESGTAEVNGAFVS